MEYALVAIGGAAGAVCRVLAQSAMGRLAPTFPWGTVLVNVVGCLLIGALTPLLGKLPPNVKPLAIGGFLGGLTTMSSYAMEVVALKDAGRTAEAVTYGVGGAAACIAAATVGFACARALGVD